ncbi:hypothetical protein GCM10027046_31150 [Uliginosibacterium flavum]|uniref:Uncharacterized protein n=1 Tax=Uliginosibacterium flavum TaxID=1396831 RepID=A0ABV2TS68_9RHOO
MKGIYVSAAVSLILAAMPAQAEKTYTPEQLRKMVQSGKYPAQGPLAREETTRMSWVDCLAKTEAIIGAVTPTYPSTKLVDTKIMTSTKVWVNDSAMTVSCYADGRLHLTSAPYK